jgi:hypothetical protein
MVRMSEMISFGGGIAAGLLTNAMWDLRSHILRHLTRLTNRRSEPLRFDPLSVGFYPINQWTPARLLERRYVSMNVTGERPDLVWFDQDEWRAMAKEHAQSHSGDTAYLVAFDIDHRESGHGEFFSYTVAPCDYSEHLATVQYLDEHPATRLAIAAQLEAGRIAEFARQAPPSLVKINVAVLSGENRFLAIQRSGAVYGKRGLWTAGPNETMRLQHRAVPGTAPEDLFGLAERCLREELGLEPSSCESITISWIGYEARTASIKIFAQARTFLSELVLAEAMGVAHGLYEAQRAVWLPFTRHMLLDIVGNWDRGDSGGRLWSSSAPFALQELWRMRPALAVSRP